jgi:hypothetical protein
VPVPHEGEEKSEKEPTKGSFANSSRKELKRERREQNHPHYNTLGRKLTQR